jgi:hypothetical protein
MKFEDKRSVMYKQSAGMSPLSTGILLANKKRVQSVYFVEALITNEPEALRYPLSRDQKPEFECVWVTARIGVIV